MAEWLAGMDSYGPSEEAEEGEGGDDADEEEEGEEAEEDPPTAVEKWFNAKVWTRDILQGYLAHKKHLPRRTRQ